MRVFWRILATGHLLDPLLSSAMALGIDAARKLETVVKRLHFLGAPKAGSGFFFLLFKTAHVKTPLFNSQTWLTSPDLPCQILSAAIILLALSSNVVIFSEVAGLNKCGVQHVKTSPKFSKSIPIWYMTIFVMQTIKKHGQANEMKQPVLQWHVYIQS